MMRMCKIVWYKSGISFVSLAGMKRTVSLKHSLYPFNFFSDTPKMVKYQWQKNWTIIQHDKMNSKNHFPTGYTAWYKTTPVVKRHSTTNSALLIPTPFDNIHLLVFIWFYAAKKPYPKSKLSNQTYHYNLSLFFAEFNQLNKFQFVLQLFHFRSTI